MTYTDIDRILALDERYQQKDETLNLHECQVARYSAEACNIIRQQREVIEEQSLLLEEAKKAEERKIFGGEPSLMHGIIDSALKAAAPFRATTTHPTQD